MLYRPSKRPQGTKIRQILIPEDGVVTSYSILALQRALNKKGLRSAHRWRFGLPKIVRRGFGKFGLLRNFAQSGRSAYFAQCSRMAQAHLFPHCYLSETVVFAFDCWPSRYEHWERFFRRLRVRLAFLTAQQSVDEFARRLPKMKTVWMPEAASALDYSYDIPLVNRRIAVLELGRKYDCYHNSIVSQLADIGAAHRFEARQGKLVFPTRTTLVDGLGSSKISICFPAALTHAEYAGGVETVTLRYFESLASRCVIVGHAPKELIDIFGYNPVIEADLVEPGRQLKNILGNIHDYQQLVEDNYKRFLKVGTWDVRAESIIGDLHKLGYTT